MNFDDQALYDASVTFEGALEESQPFEYYDEAVEWADRMIEELRRENPDDDWEVAVYDTFECQDKYRVTNPKP